MTEKKRVFVVEISPVVADDGSTQKFLFSTKAFGTLSTDTPPNTRVRNCLRNPGTFTRNLFANARVTGVITPDYGNIILANRVPEKGGPGELDDWVDYGLAGSVVNVYWGVPGDAYPSAWTFVYTAFCHSFVADATEVVLRLRDQLQLLDQPLVAESFAGTGGLEGTGGVSKPKQWVSGDPGFIEPILLDVNKQIYFVQSTGTYLGSPTALTDTSDSAWGLFEGGSRLTHDGLTPYASLDQLQTVEPPSGKFRYYLGPSNPLLSSWYDGPVYFRLGTPPVTDLRVFPVGVPSSTDMIAWGGAYGSFTVPNLAIKAGVSREDVDTDHAIGVTSRLVNDSTSYLEVMADSALSEQGWFGFNRLGVFHSGHLLDPADNEFYYGISSGAGIPAPASNPTTSLHTFDADKVLNLRREPVAGMEVPIWNVTLNAGDTWPSALVTGVSPQMKDYLTRTPKWLTTSGVSSSTLLANPGAAKDIVEIHSRVLQNSFSCRLWLERYFVLYGGRRHFFTFTVPMSDALLALDMHDVVTLRGSRYGLSAGKKFRIISLTLDCSTPVPHITYGLWGGTAGQYTGAIGGGTGGGGGGGGGGSGVDIGTTLPSRQLGDFTGSMIGTVSVSDVNPPPYADPNCSLYYNNMKAFIEFNGTAGATSFADSGPQGLTLTGTATYAALDTTIKKFGSASLKILNLTSDGASIANTSALGNTAGQPISIQCWFYVDVWPASAVAQLFDLYNSAGSTGAWVGFRGTSGNLRLTWNFGAGGSPTGSIVISMNAWHHMALEDPGDGSVTLYLDGAIDSTFVASTFSRATSNKLCIGGYHAYGAATSASGEEFYVDAFEYVSGHQVYLSTFTPPTSPTYALQCIANGASELSQVGVMGDFTGQMVAVASFDPNFSSLVLLLHLDGTNGAATTVDSSTNPKTVTVLGSATLSTSQVKFGATSLTASATGSVQNGLQITDSTEFDFGSQDFTFGFWFYAATLPNTMNLISMPVTGGTITLFVNTTGQLRLQWTDSLGSFDDTTASTYITSTWSYIELVRRGNSVELWIDRFMVLKEARGGAFTINCSGNWYIGCASAANTTNLNGYIDEFALYVGVAVPTVTHLPGSATDPNWANTTLFMTGGSFADSSSFNKTITTSGSPSANVTAAADVLDDAVYKGAASAYFKAAMGTDGNLTGDFTIEMFLINGSQCAFCSVAGVYLYNDSFQGYGGSSVGSTTNLNSFDRVHVAITRSGTTIRSFVNGKLKNTQTSGATVDLQDIRFGYYIPNTNLYWTGAWDDIKITNGVARYTSDFLLGAVPTEPSFPLI